MAEGSELLIKRRRGHRFTDPAGRAVLLLLFSPPLHLHPIRRMDFARHSATVLTDGSGQRRLPRTTGGATTGGVSPARCSQIDSEPLSAKRSGQVSARR